MPALKWPAMVMDFRLADKALAGKVKAGGSGVWGSTPMPPQPNLSDADAKLIAQWLAAGAKP